MGICPILPRGAPQIPSAEKKEPSKNSKYPHPVGASAIAPSVLHSILAATVIYKTRRRWSYECPSDFIWAKYSGPITTRMLAINVSIPNLTVARLEQFRLS